MLSGWTSDSMTVPSWRLTVPTDAMSVVGPTGDFRFALVFGCVFVYFCCFTFGCVYCCVLIFVLSLNLCVLGDDPCLNWLFVHANQAYVCLGPHQH